MLTIYQALIQDDADRPAGEESERFSFDAPTEEIISMGIDRPWGAVAVHSYRSSEASDEIKLVLVHPLGEAIPPREAWSVSQIQAKSFHVELSPSSEILGYGWDMIGRPPKIGSRLFMGEPTEHPTLMKEVLLPWKVDRVETYEPVYEQDGESPYPEIRLCWCVALKEAIAA